MTYSPAMTTVPIGRSCALMSRSDYRPFVPAPGQSRITGSTPRAHAEARLQSQRAQELFGGWAELAKAPFTGITTDGHVDAGPVFAAARATHRPPR